MTMWQPLLSEIEGPRYRAIADAIERDVATGALVDGMQLPTHRELADALGVTVGTVTRGYAEAQRRGLTVGEVGRGTFVRARTSPEDFGWRATQAAGGVIDMSLACPWTPPDGSDGRELARTLREIGSEDSLDELLVYDPATAPLRHRTVASAWFGKLGHEVAPDQVIVTSGAQHAITVILAALLRPGDTLATAEVTYPAVQAIARVRDLRLRGIALDEEGIVPAALDAACEGGNVAGLYCVPALQNPTGVTMSEARRRAIAEVARRRDLVVIEDLHLPVPDLTIPPIAAFAPERTLVLATLSKWVTFGLRVGFIAAPERAVDRLRGGLRSSLWQSPALMTEVATRWLTDGTAERIARRKARELEARHAIAREVLEGRVTYQTAPRALSLWIHLPEPQRSDECVAEARRRGVLIAGAEAFAVGRVPRAVRVSLGQVPHAEDVRRGLTIVREVVEGCGDPCTHIL